MLHSQLSGGPESVFDNNQRLGYYRGAILISGILPVRLPKILTFSAN